MGCMTVVCLRSSLFACVLVLGFWGASVLPVHAVEGTCSWHGGINCAAGADWDGSAICNDGWRDSTERYSSAQMCKGTLHSCTPDEKSVIDSKYEIEEQFEAIQVLINQMGINDT